jgi:hypothetical protein
MANGDVGTRAYEISDVQELRPHLLILGAGASRAAFPNGELQGYRLPLMADFCEIVPVAPILEKDGIQWRGKNFEEVYSSLYGNPKHDALRAELEEAVFCHFSDLYLPETPTLYDLIVLSLRKKDVIATFNWDPFLVQALQRNGRITKNLPTPLFLHGNVAHGYCERDRFQGVAGQVCPRCNEPLKPDQLLFPVTEKNYSLDAAIAKAWEVLREALKKALVVTVFGYSAPASDKDALATMAEAWGPPAKRQFELLEMIDIRPREEVRASWERFIFSGHYRVSTSFLDSFLATHPRRSSEAFLSQYIHANFLEGNRVPEAQSMDELHTWFQPLFEAEDHASATKNG